jgi:hypothetical protein
LPLDPWGVVYDAVRRTPVQGAVVEINGPAGFDPAQHLLGGSGSARQTVDALGLYYFQLLNAAPAGVYTLYIVPQEGEGSKLAFSRSIGKWGVPVDEANDQARVPLKKTALDRNVDQLTIAVQNTPPQSLSGVIRIQWEKTEFSLPFTVKK